MKSPIFIDTGYFLAMVNKRDKYHAVARQVPEQVKPPFITSDAIRFYTLVASLKTVGC